jgi:hypothetical protein
MYEQIDDRIDGFKLHIYSLLFFEPIKTSKDSILELNQSISCNLLFE